jgi:hypothetical protein
VDDVNSNPIRNVATVNIVAYFRLRASISPSFIMATCAKSSLMPVLLSFERWNPRVLPCARWRAGRVFPIMRPTVVYAIKTN